MVTQVEPIPRTNVAKSPGSTELPGAEGGNQMHGVIYVVGLIVVILAILSFFGLR